MNAKFIRLMFLSLVLAPAATAQITITADDIESIYTTQTATTYYDAETLTGLQSIADQTGANLTFDFTTATYGDGETSAWEAVPCTSELPGCDNAYLSRANLVVREVYTTDVGDSTAILFMVLNEDSLAYLGAAARGDFAEELPGQEEIAAIFSPPWLLQQLPLTMGTTWTTETTQTFDFGDLGGVEIEVTDAFEVTGWGTLVTPEGSEPALRVDNLTILRSGFGGIVFVDSTYSVSFVTRGAIGATLDVDEDGTVLSASHTYATGVDTATEEPEPLPQRVTLAQNFPNPFNPSTTITYTLAEPQRVRLAVYDVLGREVALLADGFRAAGTHEVIWAADGLPSGAYLYQLDAGTTTVTRQLSLIQ
jgi:hypothetical protein